MAQQQRKEIEGELEGRELHGPKLQPIEKAGAGGPASVCLESASACLLGALGLGLLHTTNVVVDYSESISGFHPPQPSGCPRTPLTTRSLGVAGAQFPKADRKGRICASMLIRCCALSSDSSRSPIY